MVNGSAPKRLFGSRRLNEKKSGIQVKKDNLAESPVFNPLFRLIFWLMNKVGVELNPDLPTSYSLINLYIWGVIYAENWPKKLLKGNFIPSISPNLGVVNS